MGRIFIDTNNLSRMAQRHRGHAQRIGDLQLALQRLSNRHVVSRRASHTLTRLGGLRSNTNALGLRLEQMMHELRRQSNSVLAAQRAQMRRSRLHTGQLVRHSNWRAFNQPRRVQRATTNPSLNSLLNTVNQLTRGATLLARGPRFGSFTPPFLRGLFAPIPSSGPSLNARALALGAGIGVTRALQGRSTAFGGGFIQQFRRTLSIPKAFGAGPLSFNNQVGWALGLLRSSGARRVSTSQRFNPAAAQIRRNLFTFNNPVNRVGAFINRPSGLGGSL